MLERRGVCGKPGKKLLYLEMWNVPNDQKAKRCECLNMFLESVHLNFAHKEASNVNQLIWLSDIHRM